MARFFSKNFDQIQVPVPDNVIQSQIVDEKEDKTSIFKKKRLQWKKNKLEKQEKQAQNQLK